MDVFTDLAAKPDKDGIYDFAIDPDTRDLQLASGMDSALLVSLHTDRRARPDEVADPWKRRGWCGDDYDGDPEETWGSGLWLYEQARLNQETVEGVKMEVYQCMSWLLQDKMAQSVDVDVVSSPSARQMRISVHIRDSLGRDISRGYAIWQNTPAEISRNYRV